MQKDWIETTLGKVCFTTSGGTPSRRNDNYYNGSIPWVKSGELDKGIIYETEENITEEAIQNSSAKLFPKGTLLIALYGATIGKLAFLGTEATTNQAICGIFENANISSKYLYHYLFYKKQHLIGQGTGGAQPNISQTILKKLELPIPPLPEQRAIVAKIEQLFSELDNGIANLKTAQEQLKVYRQAVLKKAFEGEWMIKKIKDVCENIKVGVVITPSKYYSNSKEDVLAFRSANVREFRINNSKWVRFNKMGHEINNRTELKLGDVLIVRSGYPGTSCVVTPEYVGANAIDILIASPNTNIMTSKYLCAFNNSPLAKGLFSAGARGVAQKHLNVGVYSNLEISVPPVEKQHQIVQQIESRLSVCDKVEETIAENLQKAEALRQSILKKAFAGELLTDAEIAACKKEQDWEPAGELLKRIKKEKNN